jgi:hypothetical protein
MALKLGAYTACLHDRPLADALEVLKGNGLTSVEVNTGGFIPSPHCHVDLLLASEQARADYLGEFSSRGMDPGQPCRAGIVAMGGLLPTAHAHEHAAGTYCGRGWPVIRSSGQMLDRALWAGAQSSPPSGAWCPSPQHATAPRSRS